MQAITNRSTGALARDEITDAGLPHLAAALPRLRGVEFCSSPGVTLAGTRVFNAAVRVKYWT